jgi:hypothetical protein
MERHRSLFSRSTTQNEVFEKLKQQLREHDATTVSKNNSNKCELDKSEPPTKIEEAPTLSGDKEQAPQPRQEQHREQKTENIDHKASTQQTQQQPSSKSKTKKSGDNKKQGTGADACKSQMSISEALNTAATKHRQLCDAAINSSSSDDSSRKNKLGHSGEAQNVPSSDDDSAGEKKQKTNLSTETESNPNSACHIFIAARTLAYADWNKVDRNNSTDQMLIAAATTGHKQTDHKLMGLLTAFQKVTGVDQYKSEEVDPTLC